MQNLAVVNLIDLIKRLINFVNMQERNYKVLVVAAGVFRSLEDLSRLYSSLYIKALGADIVELGSLNSVGLTTDAVLSPPLGWISDRYGLKKVIISAIALALFASLVYASAWVWWMAIPAVILEVIAMRIFWKFADIAFTNSLTQSNRAMGMGMTRALSGIPSIAAPLIAAFIISTFGGINVQGIRPLYYVQIAVIFLLLLFIAKELSKIRAESETLEFIRGFRELFVGNKGLKCWILLNCLRHFSFDSTRSFISIFANEIKGADPYILGEMGTATMLVYLLFSLPFGRLGDMIGRKKAIYFTRSLGTIFYFILIFAPRPEYLIAAGIFEGFYMASTILYITIGMELVPQEQKGRWSGFQSLLVGLSSAPAPIIGGIIWEKLNPANLFLLAAVMDLISLLLILTVPETLNRTARK